MRTLFMLGIALIIFLLGNSFMIYPVPKKKDIPQSNVKVSDAEWQKLHLMIERSSVDTVKANFNLFVNKNALNTTALNCSEENLSASLPLMTLDTFTSRSLKLMGVKSLIFSTMN